MSDQQNKPPLIDQLDWNFVKDRLKSALTHLVGYLKNPVEGIKKAPSWDWPTVLILSSIVSGVTGILSGIVEGSILAILTGVLLKPFYGAIISGIGAGILFYASIFLLNTTLEYKKLFIIVVLALIPGQILSILAPLFRPIHIAATLAVAYLIIVGVTENFLLDRKRVTKIVSVIAGIYLLAFLLGYLQQLSHRSSRHQEITPETLDQITRELESK